MKSEVFTSIFEAIGMLTIAYGFWMLAPWLGVVVLGIAIVVLTFGLEHLIEEIKLIRFSDDSNPGD